VRRRRAPWLIAAEVDAARAWRQAARGRLAAAEALYARSLARVRTGLERVPADERGTFLADARRANLREALLAVRRARLAAAAAGAFFDPLDQPAVPGRAGAAAAQGLAGARAEVARLREVIEIGRHLNTLMPVRELLDRVLESAMKFLRAERGFLVLGSPEEFRFAASRDAGGHEVPEAGFAVSRSVLAEVLRTARPLLSSDARADARFTSKESVLALDLHSVLVAPLVARDEVLGALYVDNSHATGVFDEADRDLLVLFAAQAAVAVANARLHETRLEKERLDQELAIARAIQQGLLPRDLPGPSGFRVAALMEPARDIGGDYYDFLPGPHGGHRVAIGDVSGKGVPAALFMVMARTVLRSVAGAGGLKEALVAANAILESQIEDDKFMTMLLLEPDPDGRCVRYCLAGHEPPITWRAASGRAELLGPGGLALGILPDVLPRLEESVVETAPGDLVVCYTDGVLDCASPDGERFGRERLLRFVARHGGRGAAGLLEALRAELEAFRSAGERADDVTLLILEAGPAPGGRGA
jgi:sigma-B regulation protein RsbU (phosphoserine phosphatase)